MAYKRRRTTKRRYVRKRPRRYKRRYRRVRRSRQKYYHFRRAATVTGIVTSTTGPETVGSGSFALSQVFTAGEFTNLFDAYRINCVVLKIVPDQGNPIGGVWTNQPITPNTGQFHWCYDYNDNALPTIAQIAEYSSYKTTPANRSITIKLYPKPTMIVYNGGVTNGYAQPKKMWLDMGSPSIPHYVIKFGWDNFNWPAGQARGYRIRPIYYLSFKGAK